MDSQYVQTLHTIKGAPASVLFALLFNSGSTSTQELAWSTGWSDAKVSSALRKLKRMGLVKQVSRFQGWILTPYARQLIGAKFPEDEPATGAGQAGDRFQSLYPFQGAPGYPKPDFLKSEMARSRIISEPSPEDYRIEGYDPEEKPLAEECPEERLLPPSLILPANPRGDLSAVQAWRLAVENIRQEMPKFAFEEWVVPSQLVRFEPDSCTFTVAVPGEEQRQILEARLAPKLVRHLFGLCNRQPVLEFVVSGSEEATSG